MMLCVRSQLIDSDLLKMSTMVILSCKSVKVYNEGFNLWMKLISMVIKCSNQLMGENITICFDDDAY